MILISGKLVCDKLGTVRTVQKSHSDFSWYPKRWSQTKSVLLSGLYSHRFR